MGFLPSDDHDLLLWLGHSALHHRAALTSLDIGLCGTNIHTAVLLKDVELVQRVECWGILDVSSGDIKARYTTLARFNHRAS